VRPSADNIATFVEVVRQRSLSAAARSLGLPKSTISRRLMRLERSLQSKLLQRNARTITLTNAGREFYGSVVFAVDALGEAVAALEQSSQEPRGQVRITAPPDLGRMLLSPMLGAFLQRQPEINLHVKYSNDVLDLVAEGLDLAVRATSSLRQDLIARRLCRSQLQLAASPEIAAGLAPDADIRSLAQQAFVLYGQAARTQHLNLARTDAKAKRQKPLELEVSGRISVDDYAALAELVARGQGLGLMPAIHVQAGVSSGRLVHVFPEWGADAGSVYLVYANRQQPERVRLLSEFLLEAFAKLDSV
jgi:DNA-binding transcriptional LysR family regulator